MESWCIFMENPNSDHAEGSPPVAGRNKSSSSFSLGKAIGYPATLMVGMGVAYLFVLYAIIPSMVDETDSVSQSFGDAFAILVLAVWCAAEFILLGVLLILVIRAGTRTGVSQKTVRYAIMWCVLATATGVGLAVFMAVEKGEAQAEKERVRMVKVYNDMDLRKVDEINHSLSVAKQKNSTVSIADGWWWVEDSTGGKFGQEIPEGISLTYNAQPDGMSSYSIVLKGETGCVFTRTVGNGVNDTGSLTLSGDNCETWNPVQN